MSDFIGNAFPGQDADMRSDYSSANNPAMEFSAPRDFMAEAATARSGSAAPAGGTWIDPRLADVALALCDKGYSWAEASAWVAQYGNNIPHGAESQCIAWVSDNISDRR